MSGTQIPTQQRKRVKQRDGGRCARCQMVGAQWHHRRSRRVRDAHRHCACNGVWLCPTCHKWAHSEVFEATAWGFVLSQFETEMYLIPFRRLGQSWMLPSCDGLLQPVPDDRVRVDGFGHPRLFQAV
jgi:5-methylcytosine-specific restriction protein A